MSIHTLRLLMYSYLFSASLFAANDNYIIRPATSKDLPEILALDRKITFEFFKPLLLTSYSHMIDPKKVDYFLELELANDTITFPEYIKDQQTKRLNIAYDNNRKCVIGFLSFHKDNDLVELDFLVVDKNYRKMGIGKKLVLSAKAAFDNIKSIVLITLKNGNNATHKFYESLGFKNVGSSASHEKNIYGVPYSDMYFCYVWTGF